MFCLITASPPQFQRNTPRRGKTPPDNPQSEDSVTRRRKEHADLPPRERKTANCFGALEATHNRPQPDRRPMADEFQSRPWRTTLSCQATARQQQGCHRACKERKPSHSKATPVTMESPYSDHCRRRARHSQPNTTTSLVSRSPAACSLEQSSAVSRCREIQPRLPNLQPNVSGAESRRSCCRSFVGFTV